MSTNQIKESLLALAAARVAYFSKQNSSPSIVEPVSASSIADVVNCCKCSLAESRKRVVCDSVLSPHRILALLEYPEVSDEESATLLSNESAASHLLSRLFSKLHIQTEVFVAFAAKCVPRGGLPNSTLECCRVNLGIELNEVKPSIVFAFGRRAQDAVLRLAEESSLATAGQVECGLAGTFRYRGGSFQLYLFPSVRELRDFPDWRGSVWSVLQDLFKNG